MHDEIFNNYILPNIHLQGGMIFAKKKIWLSQRALSRGPLGLPPSPSHWQATTASAPAASLPVLASSSLARHGLITTDTTAVQESATRHYKRSFLFRSSMC